MLLSYLVKVDEGVTLFRFLTCVTVDESQSVANEGVDTRHQLHMVLDVAALRRANYESLILAIKDVERGFPSVERVECFGQPVGAVTHMDDIGMLPRDILALRVMLDTSFEWLWRHGHRAAAGKLKFAMLEAFEGDEVQAFDYVWLPSVVKIEELGFARRYLVLRQALWTWTAYARPHIEWPMEVWPTVSDKDMQMIEGLQQRALKALLGRAV
ncbi:hypothetical protein M885DRAFT_570753 [Pelagophyceae sp. CCMP2097]|nr:hypothetical protein M885DRAFT_570753 [Pelagophyceae sp. CCMP2097]